MLESISYFFTTIFNERFEEAASEIVIFVLGNLILLFLTYLGRGIFLNAPLLRMIFLYRRYSYAQNVYLQIVEKFDGDRRYSFLYFFWDSKLGAYRLKGFQYTPEGVRAADFESNYVTFPNNHSEDLGFVWKASFTDTQEHVGGYTHMRFEAFKNGGQPEGSGFFITFDKEPVRYDLVFHALTKVRLKKFGKFRRAPKTHEERSAFVKAVHPNIPKNIRAVLRSGEVAAMRAA